MIKYIIPFTAAAVFQLFWNIVLAFHLGDDTALGNWLYGRNCHRMWNCDGILVDIICVVAIVILGEIYATVLTIRKYRAPQA